MDRTEQIKKTEQNPPKQLSIMQTITQTIMHGVADLAYVFIPIYFGVLLLIHWMYYFDVIYAAGGIYSIIFGFTQRCLIFEDIVKFYKPIIKQFVR